MSLNKACLIGRLGNDPEIKNFDNGGKVANFSLATSETWTKDGEKKISTEWHNISVFGKLAEIVEKFVKKGDKLYLEGKIKTRSWEDQDGNKKYITEIILNGFGDKLQMLGGKNDNSTDAPCENDMLF